MEETYYIPCTEHNCFAYDCGNNEEGCTLLTDNDFKGRCPFYKPKPVKKTKQDGINLSF